MNGEYTAHTVMARVLAFAISAIGDRHSKQTWDALFRDIFRRSSCEDFLESVQELQVAAVGPRGNPVGDSYRPGHGRSASGAGRKEWGRLSPIEGTCSRNSSAQSSRPSACRLSQSLSISFFTSRVSTMSRACGEAGIRFGRSNTHQWSRRTLHCLHHHQAPDVFLPQRRGRRRLSPGIRSFFRNYGCPWPDSRARICAAHP
jgi:hypothetical protein